MKAAVGVMLAAIAVGATAADDLGRLFFTPDERARLDAARRAPAAIDVAAEDAPVPLEASPAVTAAPPPSVTVNGLVLRARGPSTAWVNGAPATRQDLHADPARDLRIARDAVEIDSARGAARVKPGQTYDPAADRVVEGFERAAPAPSP